MVDMRRGYGLLAALLLSLSLTACGSSDPLSLVGEEAVEELAPPPFAGQPGPPRHARNPRVPRTIDWREEVIYFAMTDRMSNAIRGNDDGAKRPGAGDEGTTEAENPLGWHGGDFAGLTHKIREGYFQKMGFTALWLSPVYLQVPALTVNDANSPNDGKRFAGYHGYWGDDFFRPDPHFGTLGQYKTLVRTAQQHGIKVIQDMVVNHAGYDAALTRSHPEWFHSQEDCERAPPAEKVQACDLAGLPDFNDRIPEVRDFLNSTVDYWVNLGIDGIRMDTVKHVYDDYWQQFFAPGGPGDPSIVWTVGEIFDGRPEFIATYLDELGMPSAFDFPLYFRVKDHLSSPAGNLDEVAVVFDGDAAYSDPSRLTTFIDNHDVPRFMSEAANRGVTGTAAAQRLDMALSLIYTVRGTPSVYYGTENAMLGKGDPYSHPPFEGNRVKMDFAAGAPLAGRLAALAQARRDYRALTHGAQRELWRPNGREPVFAFRRTLHGEAPVVAVLNNGDSPIDLARLSAGSGGIPLQGTFAPGATLTEVTGRGHGLSVTPSGLLVGVIPPRTLLALTGSPGEDEEPVTATATFTVDARSQGDGAIELRRFDTGREVRYPMTEVAGRPGFWEVRLEGLERFRNLSFKFGNAAQDAKNSGYEGFGQDNRSLYLDGETLRYEGVYNFVSTPAPDAAITGTVSSSGTPLRGALVDSSADADSYYAFSFADGSYHLPFPSSSSTDLTAKLEGYGSKTLTSVTAPASGQDFELTVSASPKYSVDGDLSDWTSPRAKLLNGPEGYDQGFGPDNLFTELLVDWDDLYLYLGYRYRASGNSAIVHLDTGHLDTGAGGSASAEGFDAWPRLVTFANPIDYFVAQYQGEPLQLREVVSDTEAREIGSGFAKATAGTSPAFSSEVAIPWAVLGFSGRPEARLNVHAGIYGGDRYGAGDIAPNSNSTPPATDNTIAGFDQNRRADFQTPFSVMITD
ncbi:MAG: alpha-amylase family glycosyl hydrolase [Deinococcota bacterium]|nr:alpha-amylase family glycosyl hydrolase [Deinococcota bacterium]